MTRSTEIFLELLACPRCEQQLARIESGFRCEDCTVDYPEFEGMPWLFSESDSAFGDWSQRLNFAVAKLEAEAVAAERSGALKIAGLTRDRLGRQAAACRIQAGSLKALLKAVRGIETPAHATIYQGLKTRLPADQGLNTYFPNIHRDWNWGAIENQASLAQILNALGDAESPARVLVLGAGAARLAYDLSMSLKPELLIALDFNPLLMLLASKFARGEKIDLYEFPIAPKTLSDHAVLRTLGAPSPAHESFHCVVGDALRAPFTPGSFDLVVTPWLIDIISDDLPDFAKRVNRLLHPKGRWISFGSLAFRDPDPARCYSEEEVLEIIARAGFEQPDPVRADIPYMNSPASRHARTETVTTLSMRKTKELKKPERYQALPDWIIHGNTPVPASMEFQSQAAATRIHAFVMTMIDGNRTLTDMATLMEQQQLMPKDQAEDAVRGFLIKMYDDARRYSGF